MKIRYEHPISSCKNSKVVWEVTTITKKGLAVVPNFVCEYCGIEPKKETFESVNWENYDEDSPRNESYYLRVVRIT